VHWSNHLDPHTIDNTFVPIKEMNRTDADIILVFLMNKAVYTQPIVDPWFDSRVPEEWTFDGQNVTLFAPRQPVSVLGCADQTEVCNPAMPGACMDFTRADDMSFFSDGLKFNARQSAVFSRLFPLLGNSIPDAAYTIGAQGLLASYLGRDGISAALEEDQWVLELQNWYLTTNIQIRATQYVTGLGREKYRKYITAPKEDEQWMCTSQIVRSSDYASFSVLGSGIILFGGAFLILLNLSLSTIAPRVRRNSPLNQYRNLMWQSNELLELLRRANSHSSNDHASDTTKFTKTPDEVSRLSSKELGTCPWPATTSSISNVPAPGDTRTLSQVRETTSAADPRAHSRIELQCQRGDFPPHELERFLSTD
jgi:hypothetical protein